VFRVDGLQCYEAHGVVNFLNFGRSTEPDATKNAPVSRGVFMFSQYLLKFYRRYAATLAAEPSTTCGAWAPEEIGMLRGFLASGISRTRST